MRTIITAGCGLCLPLFLSTGILAQTGHMHVSVSYRSKNSQVLSRVDSFLWRCWSQRRLAVAEVTFRGDNAGIVYSIHIQPNRRGRWQVTEYSRSYSAPKHVLPQKTVAVGRNLKLRHTRAGNEVRLITQGGAVVAFFTETSSRSSGDISFEDAAISRTIEISASSSVGGRPMGDDPLLRERLKRALVKEFMGAQIVDRGGDIYVIFTMVDYVPGCRPHCGHVKSYRNWTGEVMSRGAVFNLDGETYNPKFDPVKGFAREFGKFVQR